VSGGATQELDRHEPLATTLLADFATRWFRRRRHWLSGSAVPSRRKSRPEAVIKQGRELLERRLDYGAQDGESFLDAAQHTRLVASAERYYRIMHYGGASPVCIRQAGTFCA
jgi:erythromycin esterase-like protein